MDQQQKQLGVTLTSPAPAQATQQISVPSITPNTLRTAGLHSNSSLETTLTNRLSSPNSVVTNNEAAKGKGKDVKREAMETAEVAEVAGIKREHVEPQGKQIPKVEEMPETKTIVKSEIVEVKKEETASQAEKGVPIKKKG